MERLPVKTLNENDYYPFGMVMPGRSYSTFGYDFGFDDQLKDDEINGSGNDYTAEFWEYDPRIGRRWNLDPKTKPEESPYASFHDNPILVSDPAGDFGNPDKRRVRAQQIFDIKVVKPLRQLETDLKQQGLSENEVQKLVQDDANKFADKYQHTKWLHVVFGTPYVNTSGNSYISSATGMRIQEKIGIKAYSQTEQNSYAEFERPDDNATVTTGTAKDERGNPIVATPGSTVDVQFNPLIQPNALTVTTTGSSVFSTPIATTGGMILDTRDLRDVYKFHQITAITISNAGLVQYTVQNSNPSLIMDRWQLKIKVTSPLLLNPYPYVASSYPFP